MPHTNENTLILNVAQGPSNAIASLVWQNEVVVRGLARAVGFGWNTNVKDIPAPPKGWSTQLTTNTEDKPFNSKLLVGGPNYESIAHIGISGGRVYGNVASDDDDVIEDFLAHVHAQCPKSLAEEHRIPTSFWTNGQHGPEQRIRMLDVPQEFSTIAGNYTKDVRTGLEFLSNDFKPGNGQLILWHGMPGTGKTYALRSLMKSWSTWAEPHYIVDPDQFFGADASYMMHVLMETGSSTIQAHIPTDDDDDDAVEPPDPWRLLIMEDTGELLSADAKERVGQGLSRLLNIVDGMIGQGLKVMVLITTNEPVQRMHDAVKRPGRCAASVEFGPLTKTECLEWLKAHALESSALTSNMTLADLFALVADQKQLNVKSNVKGSGF